MKTSLLFFYTETPLHAGTGAGISAVDLPIQRERTTQFPNIQGSGVKGALRNQCLRIDAKGELTEDALAVFGPETQEADKYAGALSVGEARVVLFPVRSLQGIFAYVTCSQVLTRLARDAEHAGIQDKIPAFERLAESACLVTSASAVSVGGSVILEEFSFDSLIYENSDKKNVTDLIANWLVEKALPQEDTYAYWREKVKNSLVILPDNAFRDFVINSTEVVTRIRVQRDSKTVQDGALWTQEALPADTLMVSSVIARKVRVTEEKEKDKRSPKMIDGLEKNQAEDVLEWLQNPKNIPHYLQIGGDETTGHGIVAIHWQKEK